MRLLSIATLVTLCVTVGHVPRPVYALQAEEDPREAYDVLTYRLDLEVIPEKKELRGTVAVEVKVVTSSLDELVLDLVPECRVRTVQRIDRRIDAGKPLAGRPIGFEHENARLTCKLGSRVKRGSVVTVAVTYEAHPKAFNRFSGFHWEETANGSPWISTSCQLPGAHTWWPCKASFYHPGDKPERLFVNLTVPDDLYAVSNGRLTGRQKQRYGKETFAWRHDYPIETYSVSLNVAPYVVVEQEIDLPGIEDPVPFVYYVLPEHAEQARVQFATVPQLLNVFTEAFGPYPFPESKIGIVETNFLGMEHSTAIAYGNTFPAWCAENEVRDPRGSLNRWFDYILVHEFAHEWWGNAVSADDWSDFWIHEGFASYAEGVYVEWTQGREAADRFFDATAGEVPKNARLFAGDVSNARDAYSTSLYTKGAAVLNTLRYYVDDDAIWWKTLSDFQERYRFGNVRTIDFQRLLEENTGREWKRFFDEWVYGSGYPRISGTISAREKSILLDVCNEAVFQTNFHVPVDVAWSEGEKRKTRRVELLPGPNRAIIICSAKPEDIAVIGLNRVLGRHRVRVK